MHIFSKKKDNTVYSDAGTSENHKHHWDYLVMLACSLIILWLIYLAIRGFLM